MAKRYAATIVRPDGPRKGLRVVVKRDGKQPLVAEFGGISLRTQRQATPIVDRVVTRGHSRNELIQRLLADTCELCGSHTDVEVHHVRRLADLKQPGRKEKPFWIQRMAALRRKTLVVCNTCHLAIHRGETRPEWREYTGR